MIRKCRLVPELLILFGDSIFCLETTFRVVIRQGIANTAISQRLRTRLCCVSEFLFFFFIGTAPTEIYTLSLHDALPIYVPVIVMLLALVFRGIAFEFRTVSRSKTWLNVAFTIGSTLATFAQGVILGGLIQGIQVRDGAFSGGIFDWATPFALLCGLSLIAGYGLLGATWLAMKTEGPVSERARGQAKMLLLAVLVFMAVVS